MNRGVSISHTNKIKGEVAEIPSKNVKATVWKETVTPLPTYVLGDLQTFADLSQHESIPGRVWHVAFKLGRQSHA